ncbi:MAG: response regulator receiver protein [Devosia sp.]|nr:response regulator receiver protein [Devosia sp.]
MAGEETADLNGKRIIVVEDDFMLATDMCRTLRDLGATVLGPAPTPFYAMHLIGRKKIDAAVLDVRLHGANVFEVAGMLQDQGVPILFATGSDRKSIPGRFQDALLLEKPFDPKRLAIELQTLTRRPPARVPAVTRPAPASTSSEAPAQVFARVAARNLGTA